MHFTCGCTALGFLRSYRENIPTFPKVYKMLNGLSRRRFLRLALFMVCWFACSSWALWPINVITALSPDDPMYQGLLHFKENVEAATENEVTVRIFYGSQLGSDEDIIEQARAGANVAVLIDGGRLSVYVDELGVLGAPYLVEGRQEARALVTSDLFQQWAEELKRKAGLQVLSFNWWQGERHLLTHKPVHGPADLSGVRVRTIGAPVFIETIKAMGATPTPLSWAEVYPALQQKVIDGAEAQYQATYGARLYEVITHITKTRHINLMTGLVASSSWFDKLPNHHQLAVVRAALAAGDYASNITAQSERGYEQQMREEGVVISTPDLAPFIEATNPVYEALGYTKLRQRINQTLNKEQE